MTLRAPGKWGPNNFHDPDICVQYVVDGRILQDADAASVLEALEGLAERTGVLKRAGSARNPYSVYHQKAVRTELMGL